MNNDLSARRPSTGMKPQGNQPNVAGGLAAAVNSASRQETMMPGHRLREKATGTYVKKTNEI